MNLLLVLTVLSQSPAPLLTAEGDEAPNRSAFSGPNQGFRFGMGPAGTLNVMANSDLAGVTVGFHVDLSFTSGRFEARLAAMLSGFGGWNGHDGFGYLLTASAELSLRYYVWRALGFGVGAMPALSVGSFQSCSVDIFPDLGGGGGCSPEAKYFYGSIAPTVYPVVLALGGEGQNEVAVQLSWPIAWSGAYTFPSVMIRYTRMF
jgi:hypothetical protein